MGFFAYPLHPRFVHFPIAFLLAEAFLAIFSFLKKSDTINSAIGLILISWLLTIPVIITGLLEQNNVIQIEIT